MLKTLRKGQIKIAQFLGREPALRAALLQRIWGVASGPVTATLIVAFIGPVEQGYYFAFLSLGAIVMFFELGFGQIIVQSMIHAVSNNKELRGGRQLVGEEEAIVARVARRWYVTAGVLFALTALVSGYWWFDHRTSSTDNWRFAWLFYVAGMGANLGVGGSVAIIEGLGDVALVYRLRLVSSVGGALALWGTIVSGGGYYGLAAQQGVQLVVTCWFIAPLTRDLRSLTPVPFAVMRSYWYERLWPLQWRSAIVVGSSFFIYQGTTLIAFRLLGPVDGGKVGFAITIGNMLASLVLIGVSVNSVKFGALAARKEWPEFDRQFKFYVWYGLVAGFAAAILVSGLLWLVVVWGVVDGARFLPQIGLWCIFLASLTAALAQTLIIRMRCLRREPFARQNFIAALVWPFVAVGLGTYFGIAGVAAGYLGLIVLGLAIPLYIKLRMHEREWRTS